MTASSKGILIALCLIFAPLVFCLRMMIRYPLADPNDPLIWLGVPAVFAGAGLVWANSERFFPWADSFRDRWTMILASALSAGALAIGLGLAANGAFASDEVRMVEGRVSRRCCREGDSFLRVRPNADPVRQYHISVPDEVVELVKLRAPIEVQLQRGRLGRDIVAGYRLLPQP
jgi:hypothetical protein